MRRRASATCRSPTARAATSRAPARSRTSACCARSTRAATAGGWASSTSPARAPRTASAGSRRWVSRAAAPSPPPRAEGAPPLELHFAQVSAVHVVDEAAHVVAVGQELVLAHAPDRVALGLVDVGERAERVRRRLAGVARDRLAQRVLV